METPLALRRRSRARRTPYALRLRSLASHRPSAGPAPDPIRRLQEPIDRAMPHAVRLLHTPADALPASPGDRTAPRRRCTRAHRRFTPVRNRGIDRASTTGAVGDGALGLPRALIYRSSGARPGPVRPRFAEDPAAGADSKYKAGHHRPGRSLLPTHAHLFGARRTGPRPARRHRLHPSRSPTPGRGIRPPTAERVLTPASPPSSPRQAMAGSSRPALLHRPHRGRLKTPPPRQEPRPGPPIREPPSSCAHADPGIRPSSPYHPAGPRTRNSDPWRPRISAACTNHPSSFPCPRSVAASPARR